jgi:hypothetical protein
MSQTLLAILAVIAITLLFRYLSRTRQDEGTAAGRSEVANGEHAHGRYAAVSIHTFRGGCPAAEEIRGRRFLVDEAPMLPLAECRWSKCNCRYTHHSDRRSGTGDRRRTAAARDGDRVAWSGMERREQPGRRASDWAAAASLAGTNQA